MDPEINPERLRRLQQRQPLANALILAVSLVLIFPITIVALRMYVRIRIAKKVRTDDFFIILATVLSIGVTISIGYESKLGVLSDAGIKSGLALQLLHLTSAWALKMSVCCFCQNIFGRVNSLRKTFLIWASMGTVTSLWIISFGTLIFSCSPVSSLWNARKLVSGDGCINVAVQQLVFAIINAISDWLIMYLPLVLIRQSDLNSTQKKYISGIFSLAFLAVLASVGRVICYAIVVCGNRKSAAVLWVLLPVSTSFELNFAIVASALPSLSPLFRSAAQRFRGSCGKGDMDMDRESDFIKPAVFYNEQGNLHGKEEWEWQTGKLENINGKAGGGGILVERSYVVERSSNCPCFPSKALFSPRRASASAKGIMKAHPPLPTRMETREPTVEGRRLSFLEVLRQGPPPAMEGRVKGGKVLGA
ncbi:hypothetical protein EG328_010298 [Venturia inaequalis]|uniref:Rhodopsin domain-containing protein n=1 Tax=Venturia inaequalis TaxID=5025 RepID=A0A8H3V8G0_VENIN|nr:hypothetical protein EG328_010298 [Venturia inaequalis]